MATRMQQRRGTAAQWTSANPVLNAGEMGWESDTNKFKIGDGTNHWANIDYFIDSNSTSNPAFGSSIVFEGTTANEFETTLSVTDPTADRTITIPNATGTVVLADASGNITVSGDLTVTGTTTTINASTINATTEIVFEGATANDFETTLTVTDPTADRTVTFQDATGTVVLRDSTDTLTNKSISLGSNTVTSTLAQLNTAVTDADVASLTGTETLTNKKLSDSTTTIVDVSDATKAIKFDVGGTTSVTGTIATAFTTAKTLTLPDATGTVAITTDISDAITNAALDNSDDLTEGTTNLYFTTARSDLKASLIGTETLTNKTLTSPVLGGTTTSASGNIVVQPASYILEVMGGGSTVGQIQLNCPVNTHGQKIASQLHAEAASNTLTLPGGNTIGNSNAVLVSDIGTQTLTNKTLTSPTVNTATIAGGTLKDVIVRGMEEDVNVVAAAATGTINIDVDTASIWYYTSNATANHTLNFRYSSGTSLNTALATGDAITLVWMNTNGATAYYPNAITIDGNAVTPKVPAAITAGNASAIDAYSFTIIKTASATFTVLETQTKFA